MNSALIADLLDAIVDVVGADGTWQEKRDAILAAATDADRINLEEFAAWFETEERE